MFKFLFKFIIYSTIIVFMLSVSTEATKISRDKARLINAHILSQSIQYYKMIHNNLPQSGPNENISDLLLNEQILFDPMRDPVYTSSTIKDEDQLKEISPEVDQYVMSLFNQSFVLILMIIIALAAFLFFDYSTITIDYNKQLIGK